MFKKKFLSKLYIHYFYSSKCCFNNNNYYSSNSEIKFIIRRKKNVQGKEYGQNDISSEIPEKSWEKYKRAEKYLYIWEYYTPDYIINMCQEHHFTRVYLSIGCIEEYWDNYYSRGKFPAKDEIGSLDYETFIKQLNDINVEVE